MDNTELINKYLGDIKPISNKSDAYELQSEIKSMISRIFINSFVFVKFTEHLLPSIQIRFALGKSRDDWAHGIMENDPCHNLMFIYGFDKDGNIIPGKLELKGIIVGVAEKSYSKRNKLGWTDVKTNATKDKIMTKLSAYFRKMKVVTDKLQEF